MPQQKFRIHSPEFVSVASHDGQVRLLNLGRARGNLKTAKKLGGYAMQQLAGAFVPLVTGTMSGTLYGRQRPDGIDQGTLLGTSAGSRCPLLAKLFYRPMRRWKSQFSVQLEGVDYMLAWNFVEHIERESLCRSE